jgi:hypothetical protein
MALLAALSVSFVGCNSAGYKKSDAAALSLQTASAEVQAENGALEIAMGSLKELVNDPGADLRLPFRHFSSAVDKLAAAAQRTQMTGQKMALRNAAYFESWDKHLQQIEFEHVRNVSATRMNEVTNRFAVLHQRYQDSQAAIQPLISYLRDIRVVLSTDLTAAGLESVKGVVKNAEVNAAKLKTALAALAMELDDSSVRLSSMPFQNAGATTGEQTIQGTGAGGDTR